jgi:hypothetical protein
VRFLLIVLILGMIFFAGYVMGKYANRSATQPKLTRPERKELSLLRSFKSNVRQTASNHMVLDSQLAQIILDDVDNTEKELDRVRSE